jgi:hypothetical protein
MEKRTTVKLFPTLVTVAEDLTGDELIFAPELSTLAALDASLLATTTILKTSYPGPQEFHCSRDRLQISVDEHLAETILILAQALRSNLAAYYASVQEACARDELPREIQF